MTFLFVSKQTLSKIIQLTLDCGKPTAINRNSVIDQFLTDLAPLSNRENSSNLLIDQIAKLSAIINITEYFQIEVKRCHRQLII